MSKKGKKETSQAAQQPEELSPLEVEFMKALAEYRESSFKKGRESVLSEKGEWPELSGFTPTLSSFVESVLPRVKHTFTEDDLKWLAEFQDTAFQDLITTNRLVQGLAAAADCDESANELSDSSCFPHLFYGISSVLSSIEAQLRIAAGAKYRLHGI